MTANIIDKRVLDALRHTGSDQYVVRSGPTLELMSELAKEGHLAGLAELYRAYVNKVPGDRAFVADMVPAKVLNQHVYIYRKGTMQSVIRWIEQTPDWADRIKAALGDPNRFASIVTKMADEAVREGGA